jgi:hypothetical protein
LNVEFESFLKILVFQRFFFLWQAVPKCVRERRKERSERRKKKKKEVREERKREKEDGGEGSWQKEEEGEERVGERSRAACEQGVE